MLNQLLEFLFSYLSSLPGLKRKLLFGGNDLYSDFDITDSPNRPTDAIALRNIDLV